MTQIAENYFQGALAVNLVGPLFSEQDINLVDKNILNTIFVDGGAHHKKHFDYESSLSIGDGDSFNGKLDILVSPEKDQSDLKLALCYVPKTCLHLNLYGLLGARSDHELAVLGELYSFLEQSAHVKTITCFHQQKKWQLFNKGHHKHTGQGIFSLFTLKEQTITLKGDVNYQTNERPFKALSSLGISNKLKGTLELTCSAPSIIIQENL